MSACGVVAVGCVRNPFPPNQPVVARVALDGVESVPTQPLLEGLATIESPRLLGIWDGVGFEYEVYDAELLRRDLERVERYLHAEGYYEAQVLAARVVALDEHRVRVEIRVQEGAPVMVTSVHLVGLEQLPLEVSAEALRGMPLQPGLRFQEAAYEASKRHLLETLKNSGHAFATVEGSARVDIARHAADVEIRVAAGAKATLGQISIAGLSELDERRVRENLGLATGDVFSQAELDDARRALLALGVFSDVRVQARVEAAQDAVVPIHVVVQEAPLRSVRLGAGGELDPLQLSTHLFIGWEDRNFLGGLRRLTIDTKPGVVYFPTRFDLNGFDAPNRGLFRNRLQASLHQPSFLEGRTTGSLTGDFNLFPLLYAQSDAESPIIGFAELRARAGLERAFFAHHLRLAGSLNWQVELPLDYDDLSVGKSVDAEALLDPLLLAYPELVANLDFRDDPLNPHEGAFFSINLQTATPALGSDVSDFRLRPEGRFYVPISRTVTFATRAVVGFLFSDAYSRVDDTQSDDRRSVAREQQKLLFRGFFSGGPNSNRGYPIGGVGPQGEVLFLLPSASYCTDNPNAEQCDQPLGGQSLWEASVEVRFPLFGPLRGALFVDGSNVQPSTTLDFASPYLSWGSGLRYGTPIGPLRLDVGVPFAHPQASDVNRRYGPVTLHLTLGEAF